MILEDKTKNELGIDVNNCPQTARVYRMCDYCSAVHICSKRDIIRGRHRIEKDACSSVVCMKAKRQESQLQKFGVKNYTESEEFKQKAKQTCLEKYGKENYAQTEEYKNRTKQTCLERYGNEHYLATDKSKQERKEICTEKYGTDHYSKTKERASKVKQTYLDHYGVDHYSKTDEYKSKIKSTCLNKYGAEHYSVTQEFKERYRNSMIEKHGVSCGYLLNRGDNKTQQEIQSYLNSFGYNFQPNYELLNNGKEIDLYDREANLAIEYCGLYWHTECSPQPRGRRYHFDKYIQCKEKGVKLVTMFEDEWVWNKEICKNILASMLGKFKNRVYARNCTVYEVSKKDATIFCATHHLLSATRRSKISFGLRYRDELVGMMSFGNHHRKNEKNLVLNRLCFKNGLQIVGGATKLLAAAIKWSREQGYDKITTWSDNRWSGGNVYRSMSFRLDGELPPDYSYVNLKTHKRVQKQSQQKSLTKCPSGKTEREWSLINGLARIWDCGKKRWIYDL